MGNHFKFWQNSKILKVFNSVEEYEEYIDDVVKLPNLELSINSPLKKATVKKGFAHGVQFDSFWEYIFYRYHSFKGNIIYRNRSEFVLYIDAKNQQKKFHYDFVVNGLFYEVKGQYRENDLRKMEQCPNVIFIDGHEINKMKEELDRSLPGWRDDFILK